MLGVSSFPTTAQNGCVSDLPKVLLNDPLLARLNLFQFIQWLGMSLKSLEGILCNPTFTFKAQKMLCHLLAEKMRSDSDLVMVITKMGSYKAGIPPEFQVIEPSGDLPLFVDDFQHYTLSALAELSSSPARVLKTKEECDKLVPLLHAASLPWDYIHGGCQEKVDFALQLVRNLGLDRKKIYKYFAIGRLAFLTEEYDFHTAIAIELENKDIRIVDLTLNSKESLSLWEWVLTLRYDVAALHNITEKTFFLPPDSKDVFLRPSQWNEMLYGKNNEFSFGNPLEEASEALFKVRSKSYNLLAKYKLRLILEIDSCMRQCFACCYPPPKSVSEMVISKMHLATQDQSLPVCVEELKLLNVSEILLFYGYKTLKEYKRFIKKSKATPSDKEKILSVIATKLDAYALKDTKVSS